MLTVRVMVVASWCQSTTTMDASVVCGIKRWLYLTNLESEECPQGCRLEGSSTSKSTSASTLGSQRPVPAHSVGNRSIGRRKGHGCGGDRNIPNSIVDTTLRLFYSVRVSVRVLDGFVDSTTGWGFRAQLLGAADFDGDSRIEHLFWLNAYNEDGFVLYYDGFSRHAVASYGYH